MGTNYYACIDICKSCGRPAEKIHIGKSSWGWKFLFHGIRNFEYNNLFFELDTYQRWRHFIKKNAKIVNEYDDPITLKKFDRVIANRGDCPVDPYTYFVTNFPDYAKNMWVDPEGHTFDSSEFS